MLIQCLTCRFSSIGYHLRVLLVFDNRAILDKYLMFMKLNSKHRNTATNTVYLIIYTKCATVWREIITKRSTSSHPRVAVLFVSRHRGRYQLRYNLG